MMAWFFLIFFLKKDTGSVFNNVAGISCIIIVIVVSIILVIIIAIILAIAIVIDFVVFIAVTLCWSGGSWQPSTRPSSSPAMSWFQKFCSVLHVLWRSVTAVARCGVPCSIMAQHIALVIAGNERSLVHSIFFGAASQCCALHGEVRWFHAVNLLFIC